MTKIPSALQPPPYYPNISIKESPFWLEAENAEEEGTNNFFKDYNDVFNTIALIFSIVILVLVVHIFVSASFNQRRTADRLKCLVDDYFALTPQEREIVVKHLVSYDWLTL